MHPVSRVVPWLVISITVGVLMVATAALVALEGARPEVLAPPEQVGFLYTYALPLTFGLVGALILRRHPAHPEGWLFSLFAVNIALQDLLQICVEWQPHNQALARLNGAVAAPLFGLLTLILLLFPDGRPASRRWRPVVAVTGLVTVLAAVMGALGTTFPWSPDESVASFVVPLTVLVIAIGSLIDRWRHARAPTRQQIKWLTLGASAFVIELTLGLVLTLLDAMSDDPGSYYIGNAIFVLSVCLIPAGMGIGIVRHQLYDIDRLLSRTIAYGLLLVGAAVLFVASVAIFAGVLASQGPPPALLALTTTAVAVFAFRPISRRLVAWADRRVYGRRAEPVALMADLCAELSAYRSPEDGMNGLAHAARQATRSRGALVRIELPNSEERVIVAGDAQAAGPRTTVPIRVDGESVGAVTVIDPSPHREGLALLTRLAWLAAPTAADMRTIAELRELREQIGTGNIELAASRSRLAGAQAREREHLAQVLQSGVLPAVLDLRRALPAVEDVRAGLDVSADLDRAARQSGALADRIRGLAHDVLPAVLVDRGLAAGLRAHVRQVGADVTLTVEHSRRLPEQVEVALYDCGRLLIETVGKRRAGLTLAVSDDLVRLILTAAGPADGEHPLEGAQPQDHSLRLVGDRLAVLGGSMATASAGGNVTINCNVPLSAEDGADRNGTASHPAGNNVRLTGAATAPRRALVAGWRLFGQTRRVPDERSTDPDLA